MACVRSEVWEGEGKLMAGRKDAWENYHQTKKYLVCVIIKEGGAVTPLHKH